MYGERCTKPAQHDANLLPPPARIELERKHPPPTGIATEKEKRNNRTQAEAKGSERKRKETKGNGRIRKDTKGKEREGKRRKGKDRK